MKPTTIILLVCLIILPFCAAMKRLAPSGDDKGKSKRGGRRGAAGRQNEVATESSTANSRDKLVLDVEKNPIVVEDAHYLFENHDVLGSILARVVMEHPFRHADKKPLIFLSLVSQRWHKIMEEPIVTFAFRNTPNSALHLILQQLSTPITKTQNYDLLSASKLLLRKKEGLELMLNCEDVGAMGELSQLHSYKVIIWLNLLLVRNYHIKKERIS